MRKTSEVMFTACHILIDHLIRHSSVKIGIENVAPDILQTYKWTLVFSVLVHSLPPR